MNVSDMIVLWLFTVVATVFCFRLMQTTYWAWRQATDPDYDRMGRTWEHPCKPRIHLWSNTIRHPRLTIGPYKTWWESFDACSCETGDDHDFSDPPCPHRAAWQEDEWNDDLFANYLSPTTAAWMALHKLEHVKRLVRTVTWAEMIEAWVENVKPMPAVHGYEKVLWALIRGWRQDWVMCDVVTDIPSVVKDWVIKWADKDFTYGGVHGGTNLEMRAFAEYLANHPLPRTAHYTEWPCEEE